MDSIIEENQIDMSKFNFLNLDIQGCELFAIKGFDKYLNFFDFIFTEVNIDHLYENCPLLSDIDEYLSKFRFKRVELSMTEWEWGDALYIKEKK
jgi:hypothetical protein